jgi:hypothetical protein
MASRFGHDFSRIKVFTAFPSAVPVTPADDRLVWVSHPISAWCPGSECKKSFTSYQRVVPLRFPFDVRENRRASALEEVIAKLEPGEPLSTSDREPLQSLSPVPLDRVRVHNNRESRMTADLLHSEAFTIGNHVVLGNTAATTQARRMWLLAHEVAHTVQQYPRTAATKIADHSVSHQPEQEADQFADAAMARLSGEPSVYPSLHPVPVGLARKVIWKHIQELPNDLLLILDVDDGDFVGGCVRAIVPHAGVKLIKKSPHAELFNLHVGFLTNAAGEYCIFFYESVTSICEMKCFPSKEALREAWDEVVKWIEEMLKKVIKALAIAALIVAIGIFAYLIAQAIAAALLILA